MSISAEHLNAWHGVERALREVTNNVEDIDGVTDPEAKQRRIHWAQDACERLIEALEKLADNVD